jgi:hypothetical protein
VRRAINKGRLKMIKKIFMLCVILLTCSSCSEFALLASAGSVAASQNAYSKAYGALDFGVVIKTKKDIKTHTYERIRKAINERD